jgi:hypothetical protein
LYERFSWLPAFAGKTDGERWKDGWRKVERRMEKGGKTVEKAGMTNCEMKGNLVLKCGIYLS